MDNHNIFDPPKDTPRLAIGFEGERIGTVAEDHAAMGDELLEGLLCTQLGYFPKAQGHYYQRHEDFPDWVVIVCRSGTGWCETDGELRKVVAGEVLVLEPHRPHRYGAGADDPWTIFWAHIRGSEADQWGRRIVGESFPCVEVGDHVLFQQLLMSSLDLLTVPEASIEACRSASAAMRYVLAEVLRRSHFRREKGRASWLGDMLEEFHRAPEQDLLLSDLAHELGYTVPHLSRCFKELTGYSPMDYLQRLRMMKACEKLLDCNGSIADIAASVGYHDPQYFSRLFKKNHGVPPRQWRDRRVLKY